MRRPGGAVAAPVVCGVLVIAMIAAAGEEWPMAPLVRDGPAAERPAGPGIHALVPPVGEDQVLVVRWGLLPVGEVRMWTEWALGDGGEPMIALRARVRSNRALSPVFSMDGFYESLMAPDGFEPRRATWSCIERRRVVAEWLSFDPGAGVVRRAVAGREPLADVPLEGGLRDLGAAIWRFRGELMKGAPPASLRVAVGRDVVEIRPARRGEEWLAIGGRTLRALRFEPEVWREGRRLERNRYVVWFAAAPSHPLLRIQVTSPYATLVATVEEPPGGAITAR